MKRQNLILIALLAGVTFLFSSCDKTSSPFSEQGLVKTDFQSPVALPTGWTCGDELTIPLLAGKWTTVGSVVVTSDLTNIYVKYLLTDNTKWAISATHLSITTTADVKGVPNTVPGYPGNPQIGLFNYNNSHANVGEYTYTIPLSDFNGAKDFYILAHAVVENLGVATWTAEPVVLPGTVSVTLKPSSSYYLEAVITNDGILNGTHGGWCIDQDLELIGGTFNANVLSSLIPGYESLIEKPENMFKVNWLLNQDIIGKTAGDGNVFTYGDFQVAIWTLLEDMISSYNGVGPWAQTRVNEIIALTNGLTSFTPACGESFAVILKPVTSSGTPLQTIIIKHSVNCIPTYGSETAWGAGLAFPGDSWAMFFNYCID